jgi:hypothetical protein
MNYKFFYPSEDILQATRKELYHSTGKGYVVFKDFISKDLVRHLVEFWSDVSKTPGEKGRELSSGSGEIYLNCPNQYRLFEGGKNGVTFFNYFWNEPHDAFTYELTMQIQILRNIIETKPIYNEIFPINNRSAVTYVVITKKGENITPFHKDWHEGAYYDPARLQATLVLTKKGIDYNGQGFLLRNNQGKLLEFDSVDFDVNPGDLVFWKYNNEHAVQNVASENGQKGFMRILIPPQDISSENVKESASYKYGQLKDMYSYRSLKKQFLRSFITQKIILPIYSPIKKVLKNGNPS